MGTMKRLVPIIAVSGYKSSSGWDTAVVYWEGVMMPWKRGGGCKIIVGVLTHQTRPKGEVIK